MNNPASGRSAPSDAGGGGQKREWPAFLLLAFVGLPVAMTMAIAAYGFVVWLLQILFFGPPS
ncbi:periplasmic nitrate reductase, NapE protein [Thauera sp.]